ncbi:hypothetical protein LCGC14_1902060 [marine sediment metagenome]|uniref:Uncharacterized protein n=1 Tax=marine sediment metagenome TaxID=412755 RepID=A0A0F9IA54_9ZZZZ
MFRIALLTAGAVAWTACIAWADQPGKPPGAREAKDREGRLIGYHVGIQTNPITIVKDDLGQHRTGRPFAPTVMAQDYTARRITTVAQWQTLRGDIVKRIQGFFAKMPPRPAPLKAKIEQTKDYPDYTTRLVSIAFDGDRRAKLCLVIPKGLPTPAPAIIMFGAYGNGIEKMTAGVYSRTYAVHLARLGVVTAVVEHFYDTYRTSGDGELIPLAASVHMGFRAVDYLLTLKGLVHPKQIAVFGHVYGAEVAGFVAGMDPRVAACATSCSSERCMKPEMGYWGGPVWMGKPTAGLGCVQRYQSYMFVGARSYDMGFSGEGHASHAKVPFLSQEFRGLIAPRPYLSIQEEPTLIDSLRPVYKLYGQADKVQIIAHKWSTNLPVNVQEYMVDFFLKGMRGVKAGAAPEATVKQILAGLKSSDPASQLRGCRLASWWKPAATAAELDRLVSSTDPAVRRAAAKALGRVGDMKRLIRHIKHTDPVVRIAVAESMHTHDDTDAWEALAENQSDKDKWVREAKFQAMQVNPEE